MTDTPNTPSSQTTQSRYKAPLIIGLMFAIFIVPYVYVLYIYESGEIPTQGTTERGLFFQENIQLKQETILTIDGENWQISSLNNQWGILNFADRDCTQACFQSIFNTQQAISSLTRHKGKVEQIILIHPDLTIGQDLETIISLKDNVHPIINTSLFKKVTDQMNVQSSLSSHSVIIDPTSKLLLFYQAQQSVQDVLRDIKRLLKASAGGYSE